MKKRLIGIFLLFILSTQLFPVDGIRFWSNIFHSNDQITSVNNILFYVEEEVDHVHFKLKNIESKHSLYFENQVGFLSNKAQHLIVSHMGKAIDRNVPILIPPPNATL